MASKKTRVVDKWKSKKWYQVVAPPIFEGRQICEIVSSEDHLLANRIIRSSMMDMGVSPNTQTSMFTTLKFRIHETKGTTAYTKLIGHTVAPSYIRTFARRGKSLIHSVVDATTKDKEQVRIKVIAVTYARVSENTKRNLRTAIQEEVKTGTKTLNYSELMQDVLYGRFSTRLFNVLKKITMMRRAEIRMTERFEEFK